LESELIFSEPPTKALSLPKLTPKALKRTATPNLEKQRHQQQQLKYYINSPITAQTKFLDILQAALKSNLDEFPVTMPQQSHTHFNWTRMVIEMLPYIKEKTYPTKLTQIVILTVTQLTKNITHVYSVQSINELFFYYLSPAVDAVIQITHSLLLSDFSNHSAEPGKKDSGGLGSNFYSILTSFLPGGGSSPQPPSVSAEKNSSSAGMENGLDMTRRDLLARLHTILNVCVLLWERCDTGSSYGGTLESKNKFNLKLKLREKILNLLTPLAHSYTTAFIQSLMFLEPKQVENPQLIDLIYSMKILRLDPLTEIITQIIRKNSKNNACIQNVLLFYQMFLLKEESQLGENLNPNLVIGLLKECATANIAPLNHTAIEIILILLPIVFDQQKLNVDLTSSKSKKMTSDMKDLQEVCLKIFDLIGNHTSSKATFPGYNNNNNNPSMNASSENSLVNSTDSDRSIGGSSAEMNSKGLILAADRQVLASINCLSHHLPRCVDLLWTDENKEKEKVLLPWLSHIIYQLLPFLKAR